MEAPKESKRIIIVFILVLSIHIILMWLFIKIRTLTQPSPLLDMQKPLDQQPTHKKPWVALQSASSNPVLFKTAPQTIAPDPVTQPSEQDVTDSPQPPEQKKTAPEKELITQRAPSAPLIQPAREEASPAAQISNQEITQQEKKSAERAPDRQKEKPSKLTFSNLMQGFANHLQQQHANATDEYTMRGKEHGKATAEQLKHAQYGSKICAAINNAFLINGHKNVLSMQKNYTLIMRIIINKDGSLCESHILKGSDSPIIDRTIIAIINNAAQSFPPVPHFFNMEQYPCVITINDALRAIEHPEQLSWTL